MSQSPAAESAAKPREAQEIGRGPRANRSGAGRPSSPVILDAVADRIAPGLEAVMLVADRPLSPARLAEILRLDRADAAAPAEVPDSPDGATAPGGPALLRAAVARLNSQYEASGRSFRIEQVAGGYRVMTLPIFAPFVAAYYGSRAKTSLTSAALETLAIIAYRQPTTRAQLEAIRGVACGDILRSLIERRLVAIAGRAEELGRPLLYATTRHFLELFGLASLKDLPSVEELRARAADSTAPPFVPPETTPAESPTPAPEGNAGQP